MIIIGEKGLQILLDKLAFLEHEQWCHWFKYMDSLAEKGKLVNGEGKVMFSTTQWFDWTVKTNYDYDHLCPNDRESDKVWAEKVFEILKDLRIVTQKDIKESTK